MRKWHRWISLPGLVLLVVVAVTGLVLQIQGFLGDDGDAKESPSLTTAAVTANNFNSQINFESAKAALVGKEGNARLKKIEIDFRASPATLTFYTGEPSPKAIQMETGTYKITSEKEAEAGEFWMKLHSGELFGDAGRVLGVFAGLSLLFLSVSGGWMYFQMFRKRPAGQSFRKRLFW